MPAGNEPRAFALQAASAARSLRDETYHLAIVVLRFAKAVARLTGRPPTFAMAVGVIIAWAFTGPLFGPRLRPDQASPG